MAMQIINVDIDQKIKDFSSLLAKIEGVSDKKRQLWLEIFNNALTDRTNAYVLFTALVDIVGDKSTEHAVHGKTLSSYIERMSKANDQIIKLAELLEASEANESGENSEDIYSMINSKKS